MTTQRDNDGDAAVAPHPPTGGLAAEHAALTPDRGRSIIRSGDARRSTAPPCPELAKNMSEQLCSVPVTADDVFESVREPLLVLDADLRVRRANRAFYRVFRVDEADASGRRVYALGDGGWDIPALRRLLEQVLPAVDAVDDHEVDHVFPALGRRRIVLINARRVRGSGEQPPSILLAFEDVTDRRLAELSLASHGRLDFAARVSGVGLWYCDLPFDVLQWDDRVKAHFWLPSSARVTIETFYAHIHPDDREPTRAAIDRSVTDRTAYDTQFRTVDPATGAERWVRAIGAAAYDAAGAPVRFDGVTLDVTLQRQAEAAVRESHERFAIVAKATNDAVWDWDVRTHAVWWNEGVTTLFGHPPEEVGPTAAWWYEQIHPEDRDRVVANIHAIIDHGGAHWTDEYRFRRADGTYAAVLDRGYAIHAGGKTVRLVGAMQDVTARRRSEDDRERLVLQLKDQDRRKDEFLAILAHELRNPLAPVRSALQIVRHAPPASDAFARAHQIMERQVGQMVRLIDELLEVSRISQGKITLKREPTRLAAAIGAAVESSIPLIEACGHYLAVAPVPDSIVLDADPTRLNQIFLNLLNNAAKYTERGGRIVVTSRLEQGWAIVSVLDTGVGISADMLPKVFDLFTQADRSLDKSQGGLGIGLSLVRRLVELHGGTVEALSEGVPGQGCEFVVRLPARSEA